MTATGTATTASPDSAGTRARLVDVAEELFATQGIAAVSLRTVGQRAGQKNNSAAQYHFGSKLGLVNAIIDSRSAVIEQRRRQLLEEAATPADLSTLVTLMVVPLAESIDDPSRSRFYLRFLANAVHDPALREAWLAEPRPSQSTLRQVQRDIGRLLPDLPRQVFERRLDWSARISLPILADHEELRHAERSSAPGTELVVRELVEMQVALLRCPV